MTTYDILCAVKAAKRKLTGQIITQLRATYPNVRCELNHHNPLELLVATILSAQCTDQRVNQVTPALFARYRTAAAFAAAPPGELEELIKSTASSATKPSDRNCCQAIAEKHAGQVPDTLADLVQLAGCGRKTANVVLGVAFRKAEGIVVDTHVAPALATPRLDPADDSREN